MKALAGAALVLRVLAMLALLGMMAVTIVDVAMRVLIDELVLGSVEIVQWMLVAVVFLAFPETVLRDEHVTVDVVDHFAGKRVRVALRAAASLLTLLLLAAMAWRVIPPAIDTLVIGDLTTDLQLSLFWYWVPIMAGALVAAAAALWRAGRGAAEDA